MTILKMKKKESTAIYQFKHIAQLMFETDRADGSRLEVASRHMTDHVKIL